MKRLWRQNCEESTKLWCQGTGARITVCLGKGYINSMIPKHRKLIGKNTWTVVVTGKYWASSSPLRRWARNRRLLSWWHNDVHRWFLLWEQLPSFSASNRRTIQDVTFSVTDQIQLNITISNKHGGFDQPTLILSICLLVTLARLAKSRSEARYFSYRCISASLISSLPASRILKASTSNKAVKVSADGARPLTEPGNRRHLLHVVYPW